ncbi:restriction endonuclease subunit S [Mycolicibacterium tusciae]|uniref:restriction endonuclease subunit S n=1 Tax=Mycolicibacterium tusciae TaxID=75922 RepID=UPI001EF97173|nr:restriction endonuclease subunit S [Mycolicibacterium tusciae]
MPQNIGDNRIVIDGIARVSDKDVKRLSRYTLREGDIVYSRRGDVERRALVRAENQGWLCGTGCLRVRIPDATKYDAAFVSYALGARPVRRWISRHAVGATMLNLNTAILAAVPLSVPRIGSQRAIAKLLGSLDDQIASNERVADAALELGDQLFVHAAARIEGAATTIGELADSSAIEFSDGYRTKKSEHGQPGLRILRAGDVRDSYLFPAGQDYVSLDYSRQIGSKASMPGDVVLTTKGSVGRVAVVADAVERVVYSPQVCFFRVKDDGQVDRDYLGAWFRGSDLQRQTSTLMYKSDMAPYISLRDIRSLVIPLPSIEEQRRQGKVQWNLRAAFEASRVENERLVRTRDELLPLLMSGKIVVGEAEDVIRSVV